MKYGKAGENYILGGENISYRQFLQVVREVIPSGKTIAIPKLVLKMAAALQMLRFLITKKQPAFTPCTIHRYYANTAFSSQKAIQELNYKITPFKRGMLDTIHHLKQQL
jgi:hypothetical protein